MSGLCKLSLSGVGQNTILTQSTILRIGKEKAKIYAESVSAFLSWRRLVANCDSQFEFGESKPVKILIDSESEFIESPKIGV